jgi:hypothetical protein
VIWGCRKSCVFDDIALSLKHHASVGYPCHTIPYKVVHPYSLDGLEAGVSEYELALCDARLRCRALFVSKVWPVDQLSGRAMKVSTVVDNLQHLRVLRQRSSYANLNLRLVDLY